MTVTQVGLGGSGAQSAASGNISVQYPSAALAYGDIAIITIAQHDTVSITLPTTTGADGTGWTLGDTIVPTGGTTAHTGSWWWMRLNGDETGTVLVTHSAGDAIIGRMSVWRGCKLKGNPFGNKSENSSSSDGTTITGTGITTTAADSMVIFTGTENDDCTVGTFSGSIVTEQFDHLTTSGLDASIFLASGVKSTAGTTSNITCVQSRTASWTGFVIELLDEAQISRVPTALEVFSVIARNNLADAVAHATQTIHPLADSLLVYIQLSRVTSGTVPTPSVSGGSLSWNAIQDIQSFSTQVARLHAWWAQVGGTRPSAFDISNTYDGATTVLNSLTVVLEIRGHKTSTPVVQSVSSTAATGTSYTQTLAAAGDANNRSFVALAHHANEGSTPDGNTTELADIFNNSPITNLFVGWSDADFETVLGASWATTTIRTGLGFEIATNFPASQTVNAQVCSLTLTPIAGTLSFGAITVNAQVCSLTLTPIQGTVTSGGTPQTVNAQVCDLTLAPVTGQVNLSIPAQVCSLTLTPISGTLSMGAITVNAQVCALTLASVSGTLSVGAITVNAQVCAFTLTPVAGTITLGAITVNAQVAALTLTGVSGTLATGAITVNAQVCALTLAPVAGQINLAIAAQVCALTLAPVAGTITLGGVGKTAQVCSFVLSPVAGQINLVISAQVCSLTLVPVAGTVSVGPLTINGQVCNLTLVCARGGLYWIDTFTRADGDSLGSGWVEAVTDGPGDLDISSNAVVATAFAFMNNVATAVPSTGSTAMWAEADVQHVAFDDDNFAGPVVWAVPGLFTGYMLSGPYYGFYDLWRYQDEVYSWLTSVTAPTPSAGQVFRLRLEITAGRVLSAYADDVHLFDFDDSGSSLLTPTELGGMEVYSDAANKVQILQYRQGPLPYVSVAPPPQTVNAQVCALTLAPVPGQLNLTIAAQVCSLTLTPLVGTVTPGVVTITAQVCPMTLAPVSGTLNLTVAAQVCSLVLNPQAGTITLGTLTVAAQVCSMTLAGVAGQINLTLPATPCLLVVAPQSGSLAFGGVTVNAQVCTLTLVPLAGTVAVGSVTVSSQVCNLTLTCVAGVVTSAGNVNAQVCVLTLQPVAGTLSFGAIAKNAQVCDLTLVPVSGQTHLAINSSSCSLSLVCVSGTVNAGSVTVNAQACALSLVAVSGTLVFGAVSVAAQVCPLQLTAVPGTISSSGSFIQAQVAVFVLAAQAGVVSYGPATFLATPCLLLLEAVAGTIIAEQIRMAGIAGAFSITGASSRGTIAVAADADSEVTHSASSVGIFETAEVGSTLTHSTTRSEIV